jgi:hypothetical protein
MSVDQKSILESELSELFDIRKAKLKRENVLYQQAFEAKKDIKLLILMFSDGIPDTTIQLADNESLEWNSKSKRLMYRKREQVQFIEAASNEVLVRVRPFLKELVKKAKEFYQD